MSRPFSFLIIALATWRLTRMLVDDDGPWHIFTRLRESVGIEHDDDGFHSKVPDTSIAQLFDCPFCMSVWTAALCLALWSIAQPLVLIMGLSGAANLIESRGHHGQGNDDNAPIP